jgi:transposase
MMRDKELYSKIFHLQEPWKITDVDVNREEKKVVIHIELTDKAIGACPKCNEACHGYDHRIQRWRHLDTCQYRTIIEAKVLRINCETHGVLTIRVPWAEDNSHHTTLFEALIIDWLKEATIKAIAEQFDMSWTAVDRIMQNAVKRGLKRNNLKKKKNQKYRC